VHNEPSTPVQYVEPGVGCPHTPSVAPDAMLHRPPQHSVSCAHASPFWVQYDDGPHVPFELHRPEQHAAAPVPPAVHVLPLVKHVVLSGVHLPPLPHSPPQHWPFDEHEPLSGVHAFWHTLPTQLTEQQSVFAEHDAPLGEHTALLASHVCVVGSHIMEQQSVLLPHP
jgi:hypothetical protein